MLAEWWARLRALGRRREMDDDLDQELAAHLELSAEENVRRGMTPEEARRAARVQVGGLTALKERHREVRGMPMLETMWHDVRFALRLIAKDRWFAMAAVAALALGIGVNAVGFTIVNTAFLRGLPVEKPHDLYRVCWYTEQGDFCLASTQQLEELRAMDPALASLAAYDETVVDISDERAFPEQVEAVWVTANLFGVLGVRPVLGRDFQPEEDRVGAAPVVLIGHRLWRERFGSARDVLGRTVRVNNTQATIVGVMPEGMGFPSDHRLWALWAPLHAGEDDATRLRPVARVAGKRQTVEAALAVYAARLRTSDADRYKTLRGAGIRPLTEEFVGGKARDMFTVVMGAVTFVLLIACVNVANLLLSRSASRSKEFAVRLTLGASRWRVVRQLLMESFLLAAIGAGMGLLLATYGVRLFEASMADSGKPYWLVFTLDSHVVMYVAGVCVATTLLFGLAPALQATRRDTNRELKGSSRRWSGALVVVELTLAVVLLAGAGLMTRSFYSLYTLDLGFSPRNLFTFGFDLLEHNYKDVAAVQDFARRVEERIPGAAVTTGVPPRDRAEWPVEIDRPGTGAEDASMVAATPRYLEVLGVPVLRGRALTSSDGQDAVLVNERFAQKFFPGQDALGQRIRVVRRNPEDWRTIVGIVPTIRQGDVSEAYLNAVIYTPYDGDRGAYVLVRSELPLAPVSEIVRREVQAIDARQPLRPGQTLEQWMASERWPYRVFGGLFAVLAAIALSLSSVGLYAVMAYSVTQRTKEIGVRMAIGAQARQVGWLVLRRGVRQLAIGLAIGLAGAWALSQLMADLLVGIRPGDPATLAGIAVLLAAVSLAACWIPARRAARVDPLVALRTE